MCCRIYLWSVECGVCSVQCSRTRLTGLGHFHFLARQQMHLATPAEDLEGDDDVDDIDEVKRLSKK